LREFVRHVLECHPEVAQLLKLTNWKTMII
jgi:hypothetical protein